MSHSLIQCWYKCTILPVGNILGSYILKKENVHHQITDFFLYNKEEKISGCGPSKAWQ